MKELTHVVASRRKWQHTLSQRTHLKASGDVDRRGRAESWGRRGCPPGGFLYLEGLRSRLSPGGMHGAHPRGLEQKDRSFE